MKYSYFDYKKVVCILNRLAVQINQYTESDNPDYYKVSIEKMDDAISTKSSFEALDLSSVEDFTDIEVFSMVNGLFTIRKDQHALFMFQMGEEECQIFSMIIMTDERREIFKDYLPFEFPANESWRIVLTEFISKVKAIALDEKLKMV